MPDFEYIQLLVAFTSLLGMEKTPTKKDWNELIQKHGRQLKVLWPKSEEQRNPPTLIAVPESGCYQTCVINCKQVMEQQLEKEDELELRFGLKLFLLPGRGLKAVVHAVLYDKRKSKYIDPSPEFQEEKIAFIYLPKIFSPEQIKIIMENPEGVRMGYVVIDFTEDGSYTKWVKSMSSPSETLLQKETTSDLELYTVQGEVAYLVDLDGTLSYFSSFS